MKFAKKICVYLLVGVLLCFSVVLNYKKASDCEAVGTSIGIATVILGVGALCYGAYYVAQSENRENLKETFTDYTSMTVESAKKSYEFNKKLFNDFCTYAQSNGGGSASVYTAGGQSYSIDQMQEEGFPSFEKWDKEMKKQDNKPKGSLWDALSFGLDLISFVSSFFKDNPTVVLPNESRNQYYFTGDDGYVNRETGDVAINLYCDNNFVNPNNDDKYSPFFCKMFYHIEHRRNYGKETTFRAAAFLGYYSSGNKITYPPDDVNSNDLSVYYRAKGKISIYYGFSGKSSSFIELSGVTPDSYRIFYNGKDSAERQSLGDNRLFAFYSCKFKDVNDSLSYDLSDWDYLSTNVPVFLTREEAQNYITTGDYSGCLNLPPAVDTPTPEPDNPESSPLDIYLNHYRSGGYTVGSVINTNYNIAINWDGSTTNLTYILNGNGSDDSTPINSIAPKPTLVEDDGDGGNNKTFNFYINIENALNNIFNFWVIDTDAIGDEFTLDFAPAASFEPVTKAFKKLRSVFGEDTYVVDVPVINGNSDGVSVQNVTDSQILDTLYPKIEMKCPKILQDYVDTVDEDGNKVIILCDFKDYAVYFVRFRFFLQAVLWIGMIFLIMKELRVNFSV